MFIVAVATDNATQHHVLTDTQRSLSVRHKAQTGFKNTYAVLLSVLVVDHGRQQAGPQGQTHCRHFAGDWVWQNQRFFTRVNQLLNFRINEAIGNNFLIAFIVKHGFHTLQRQVSFFMAAHHQTCLYRLVRDAVIAVNAGDFFDQIFFNFHVEAPGWRNGLPFIVTHGHFAAQSGQNVSHQLISNMMANQAIQLAAAKRDGRTLWQRCFIRYIDDWAGFTTADIEKQGCCTFDSFVLQNRVNATLVTVRRIGVQAMTARTTGNRQRAEECGFQQHILRFIVHARVFTTKDTGHGQRFVVVGDDQSVGIEFSFGTVQQHQRFTLFRHAYNDAAFDAIFIERMHWLAQLEQDVVGDIHNCIDGTNTATTQFLFHPQRGWRFNVDTFDHTAEVTWARIGGINLNWQNIGNGRGNGFDFRLVQRQLVQHGNIARNADNA